MFDMFLIHASALMKPDEDAIVLGHVSGTDKWEMVREKPAHIKEDYPCAWPEDSCDLYSKVKDIGDSLSAEQKQSIVLHRRQLEAAILYYYMQLPDGATAFAKRMGFESVKDTYAHIKSGFKLQGEERLEGLLQCNPDYDQHNVLQEMILGANFLYDFGSIEDGADLPPERVVIEHCSSLIHDNPHALTWNGFKREWEPSTPEDIKAIRTCEVDRFDDNAQCIWEGPMLVYNTKYNDISLEEIKKGYFVLEATVRGFYDDPANMGELVKALGYNSFASAFAALPPSSRDGATDTASLLTHLRDLLPMTLPSTK